MGDLTSCGDGTANCVSWGTSPTALWVLTVISTQEGFICKGPEKERAYCCIWGDELELDLTWGNRQLNILRSLRLKFPAFWGAKAKRCLPTPLVHYCRCPLEMRPFIHAESYNSNRITPRKRKYYWKSAPWGIFYTALSSLMLSSLLSVKLPSLPLGGCCSLLLNTARKPCPTFK